MKETSATAISPVTNDAKDTIELNAPYRVAVTIKGVCPILFHRWSCESVEAKSKARKGSVQKKSDDVQSYVFRLPDSGNIALPGSYLIGSIINAAKFRQDPRSPRKSASDLYKAAVVSLTDLADLNRKDWDYLDQRRVVVQRNAITRLRPALLAGWEASFFLMSNLPMYVGPTELHETVSQAGLIVGVGDFRPSYGRFVVTNFKVLDD